MYRATTPTHTFVLDIDTDIIDKLLITYKQDDAIVIEKGLDSVYVEKNKISVTMSQEESKMFSEYTPVYVQIRIRTKDGKVIASRIKKVSIKDVLNDEVM